MSRKPIQPGWSKAGIRVVPLVLLLTSACLPVNVARRVPIDSDPLFPEGGVSHVTPTPTPSATSTPSAPPKATLFGAAGGTPLGQTYSPDLSRTFALHSLPGAPNQIYLSFRGGHFDTTNTVWSGYSPSGIDTPAFDTDGNPSAFSNAELERIQYIFQRVAEDFAPFDVDVTTEPPTVAGAHSQTTIIGGKGTWYSATPTASGVTFSRFGDGSPNFVFSALLSGNEKYTADVVSHEVGHTFGLYHDGTATAAYWPGWGSGAFSYGAIMGSPFNDQLSQWSSGEYAGANNQQDDIALIGAMTGFRRDDFGDTYESADDLTLGQMVTGLISTRDDIDPFRFWAPGGKVHVAFAPAAKGANLFAEVRLYDAADHLIASAKPATALAFAFDANVPSGNYYVTIDGIGFGSPGVSGGFSDYGCLGQYWLTVTSTGP